LRDAIWVEFLLVAEAHWFKRKNRFTDFIHRFDRFLEAGRGNSDAQLSTRINYDRATTHRSSKDTSNEGSLLCSLFTDADGVGLTGCAKHISANIDVITPGGEILAGITSEGDIIRSRGVFNERGATTRCVVSAGCVVRKRDQPVSRVIGAGRIAKERLITAGRVASASGIGIERLKAEGGVAEAAGIREEGLKTGGRIVAAGCVARERLDAVGRIAASVCVVKERLKTCGRVAIAAKVIIERLRTGGRIVGAGDGVNER
jgi:hypothetical protein